MPLPRSRTTSLMAAVAALGVAIAALRYASDAWAAGLFTATLLVFAAALIGAIGRVPPDLRRWGLVVFGAAYVLASLLPEGRAQLATSPLFERLYFAVHAHAQPSMLVYPSPVAADLVIDGKHYVTNPTYLGQPPLTYMWPWRGRLEAFHRVGHSLRAWLAGGLGVAVGCWTGSRRRADAARRPRTAPASFT